MKILHIVDYLMPQIGYQEFFLPKWNARHGNEVWVLCADRYSPLKDYGKVWGNILGPRYCGHKTEEIEGIHIERLKTFEVFKRPWLKHLEKKILHINPDVVWVHGTASPSAFRSALLCRKIKIPLFMDNHQCFIASRKGVLGKIYHFFLGKLSELILNKNVEKFVGVAVECCDFMETVQGIPQAKIELVPLGVDTDIFFKNKDPKENKRKELSIPTDAIVVMQTGKLDKTRRPDWLAEALIPLMRDNRNIWLLYVGNMTEEDSLNLKNYFKEEELSKRVIFNPFVQQNELPLFFNSADISVYPDSSSLSCFEAAACECAVIVNDLPASRERAETGIGLSYKRGDVNNLKNVLDGLIKDQNYRKEVGKKGRETVLKFFSYDHIAAQAEKLMHEAVEIKGSSKKQPSHFPLS